MRLRPHLQQSKLYRTRARFPVVVAGRGSGKTLIARMRLRRRLAERLATTDEPMFFYGLPTYKQARRVAWKPLVKMIPPEWIAKQNDSEMFIKTKFGSELHVLGFDKPQRFEGNQWAGGVVDECSDQRPKLFDLTIEPALTQHKGWCWRIGVPKRYGIGAEEFKAAWDLGYTSKDPDIESYHWTSDTVVDPADLERIKQRLDERDFNEQYRASWELAGGAIFHAFSDENISQAAVFHRDLPVIVGSDFNVNPMSWTIKHVIDGKLYVFDELFIRNTNTRETLKELYNRIGDHKPGVLFTGDATGRARKTSASESDYIQIANCSLFSNKTVAYPRGNPSIVNRFAACNAMLCNAADERRVFIHPKCKRLIADLRHRSYKEGTHEPNDQGDMGHMSDAFGYTVYKLFPLSIVSEPASQVIIRHA